MPVGIEVVAPATAELGESPWWDARDRRLLWVDAWKARIHIWNADTRAHVTFDLPEPLVGQRIGSVVLDQSGQMVCAMNREFWRVDPHARTARCLGRADPGERAGHRLNDGKCDRRGRYWCGSFDSTDWSARTGSLYSLGAGGSVRRHLDGIGISNGIAFSPDDRVFYFADSHAGTVWRFDFDLDDGQLSNRQVFVSMDTALGLVDGATVDVDGCYWSALCKGGAVARFDPRGRLIRRVELPTRDPTMCTFGGPNLDVLYVTTARRFLEPGALAEDPCAGHVLAITGLGVQGLEEPRFSA